MSSRVSTEPVSLPRNGSAMDFISVNSYSLAFVSAQITKVWYHKARVSGNQWFQVDQKIVDLKVYSILRQQGKYISNVCDNIVVRSVPTEGTLHPAISLERLCVSHGVKIFFSEILTGLHNALVFIQFSTV